MFRFAHVSTLLLSVLPAVAQAAEPAAAAPAVERRAVAVFAGKNVALATRLELAVEQDPGSVLLPGTLHDEARRMAGVKAGPLSDADALRLGRYLGAQRVVTLEPASRVCDPVAGACENVEASGAALLNALALSSVPESDAVSDEAMKALVACRAVVRGELLRLVTKGGARPAAPVLAACATAAVKAPSFGPAQRAVATAKALVSGSWPALAEAVRGQDADGVAAATWIVLASTDYSLKPDAWKAAMAGALAAAPRAPEVPWMKGENSFRSDQLDPAADAFGRAVALAPRNAHLLLRHSQALHLRGRNAESLAAIERVVRQADGLPAVEV